MFDYIQKFKGLPKEVYEKLSDASATAIIDKLEKEFSVSLAKLVMLVAIREIPLPKLENYISGEFNLDAEKVKKLSLALDAELFSKIKNFLAGAESSPAALPEKKAGGFDNKKIVTNGSPQIKREERKALALLPAAKIMDYRAPLKVAVQMKDGPSRIQTPAQGASQINEDRALKTQAPAAVATEPNRSKISSFFFSAEDEEEISALSSKATTLLKDNSIQSNIQAKLDFVVRQYGSIFSSADAVDRLKKILRTYLQGIRDRLETKLTLMKDYRSGGMGIDDKQASDIISALEKDIEDTQKIAPPALNNEPGRISGPLSKKSPIEITREKMAKMSAGRDVDYNLKAEIEKRKEEIGKIIAKNEVPKENVTKEKEARVKEELKVALSRAAEQEEKKEIAVKPKPVDMGVNGEKLRVKTGIPSADFPKIDGMISAVRVEGNGKRKMEDVKFTPKILTPIEELKYLDINNFRRIYKVKPEEATEKILEKISLLEEEEYAKRLAGIKALRESPLMRVYLEMGQESIALNKSMADIAEKRKAANNIFLTEAEIHAIMDLNRELRF